MDRNQPPQTDTLYQSYSKGLYKITGQENNDNIMNIIQADSGANNSTLVNIPADLIGSGQGTGTTNVATGGMQSGKQGYSDNVAGFFIGVDTDGIAKWNFGGGSSFIKWDGSTLTILGGVSVSSLDIPDTVTANSFHVDSSGNAWWGSILIAGAVAKILNTGSGYFSDITITGGIIGGATVSNLGYIGIDTANAVPTDLACSSTTAVVASDGSVSSSVVLTWTAIVHNTFDHYQIRYKKATNTYYSFVDSKTNTITIEGLVPNISYNFGISSVNKFGIPSAFSADISQTSATSTTPPATVVVGSATAGIQYVILEWTHSASTDLASYNIYRNTTNDSAGATLIGNCRTNYFIDGARTGGTILYYWVKAVNTSGLSSVSFSTVVSATPRNVVSADSNLTSQGWTQTCVFSVTDADTVAWATGVFTAANGTSYNITGSNTGNMTVLTYIYLDIAVSVTAYQYTTTATTAVGDGKVLIAVANKNTTEAIFQVFGGNGGVNVDGSSVVTGSITSNELGAGSITSAKGNIAIRGWIQTCAFTVTDADTITWGAGTFTASDGTSYSILTGNTGNMTVKTYIYLDIAVSTTAYQTTTTATTAIGDGKVLVAVAQNGTTEANFMLLNNNSYNIDAANIVTGSITANEIASATITGAKIAATTIAAGNIIAGTITGTQIAATTIAAGNMVANTITSGQIAAGTITTTQIATATITGANIASGTVASANILSLAADKVLINGVVYLSNWQKSGDLTKIDGGSISATTVTTTQLAFTPVQSTDVIAKINASAEGITIDADNLTINAATTFGAGYNPTSKVTTFAQTSIPTSIAAGDIWIDTDDDNKMYRATAAGDTIIAAGHWIQLETTKVKTFAQDAIPTSINAGDLWFDTNDGNRQYRATAVGDTTIAAGHWVEFTDANKITVAGAAADINANATTISGGKITTGSITADRMNVSTLSAISADLGSITAGSITINGGTASITSVGAATFKSIQVGGSSVQYTLNDSGIFSFGDGSDGNVTISADTTLTGDKYYNNLTIDSGKVLTVGGYRVFVKGVLTVNGTISGNGAVGGAGTRGYNGGTYFGGPIAPGGPGGGGGGGLADGYLKGSLGGAGGGSGGWGSWTSQSPAVGQSGSNGTSTLHSLGGASSNGSAGGGGGNGSPGGTAAGGGAGGAGTTVTPPNVKFIANWHLATLLDIDTTGSTIKFDNSASAAGGGGGGGGAGNSEGGAGGGGGGGGGCSGRIVGIYARSIVIGASGVISANGGNGGAGGNGGTGAQSGASYGGGGGGGGGGAGGNGGVLILVYNVLTNGSSITSSAGTGGTFGTGGAPAGAASAGANGTAGNNGSAGTIYQFQLSL